ncbi:Uncharacterized protein GBIM_09996 [Gryllus bimaculatus]|nr:Uncharacterized protein GBIM_09996 [Gryllus bimaculatus]
MMSLIKTCKNRVIMKPVVRILRKEFREHSGKASSHPRIEEPIKFAESRASTWKAKYTRIGTESVVSPPWYQGIVVSLSLGVFLLYFCVFREENDIDEELGKTLYDRIEGLEEFQLRSSLKYNLEKGLDTTAIERRLQAIEEEKRSRNS